MKRRDLIRTLAIISLFFSFFYFLSNFHQISLGPMSFLHSLKQKAFNFFRARDYLRKELEFLREVNKQMLNLVLDLKEAGLREQNKDLQNFPANVILYQNFLGKKFLIIDKGASHGLKLDTIVIGKNKELVGKIDKLSKNFSRIELIVNSSFIASAISLKTGSQALIKSDGINIYFEPLKKEPNFELNELVITSGKDGIYPKGLKIGLVTDDLKIKPIFDFDELQVIYILSELTQL